MSPLSALRANASTIASANVRPSGSPGTGDASLARLASESFAVRGRPPGFPLWPGLKRCASPRARFASAVFRLFSGDDLQSLASRFAILFVTLHQIILAPLRN